MTRRARNAAALAGLLGAFAAAAPRARAGELSVYVGRMSMNLGRAAGKGGKTAVGGAAYGARFLHPVGAFASIGLDAGFLKPADSSSELIVANGRSVTSIDSAELLGVVQVSATENKLQPRLLIGLGAHATSVKLVTQPLPGYGWVDTGTGEKRTLVDAVGYGWAFRLESGADYELLPGVLAGAFLAVDYLGTANYRASAWSRSLGLNEVSGSMLGIVGGLDLAARF